MANRKQSRGKCAFCEKEMTRGGMLKHLVGCAARQHAIAEAGASKSESEKIYHLQIKDAWYGDFWLNLEVRGSATLQTLDAYLRTIWLECCGHLSRFSIGRWNDEISKRTRIDRVFQQETELTHIYDFGTSSETLIKAVEIRQGAALTKHPIFLMARNTMPEMVCMQCGQPAEWICLECMAETEDGGLLCAKHSETHPHDEYGFLPVVNSPRMGMCGYEGPAEPPY